MNAVVPLFRPLLASADTFATTNADSRPEQVVTVRGHGV